MNSQSGEKRTTLLMSGVIFLVALNLRPAIVAVGPLLSSIGATFGWGESLQGLLGALPLFAFALFSLFVSALTSRIDTNKVLFWALVVLAGGCVVRSLFGEESVWLGTVLIGGSIAIGNVLAPAIVKRDFIDNVSFATGAYSACVTSGSALAGLTAAAAADALGGWQPALALWALPALAAAALWLVRSKYDAEVKGAASGRNITSQAASNTEEGSICKVSESVTQEEEQQNKIYPSRENEESTCPPATSTCKTSAPKVEETNSRDHNATSSPLRALVRRPSTWLVTLFMGLQSAAFYTFCNWLPSIAAAAGFTAAEAGVHLFIFQALGIFSGLLIPRFMYVRGNQICAGLLASTPLLIAALGWLNAPQLSLVWSIFGGIGQGASLVVALTLISLRGRSHEETVALSGIAQSLGYLLAACGPFAFGALTEATGGFAAPLAFMATLAAAQCALSFFAGRVPKE